MNAHSRSDCPQRRFQKAQCKEQVKLQDVAPCFKATYVPRVSCGLRRADTISVAFLNNSFWASPIRSISRDRTSTYRHGNLGDCGQAHLAHPSYHLLLRPFGGSRLGCLLLRRRVRPLPDISLDMFLVGGAESIRFPLSQTNPMFSAEVFSQPGPAYRRSARGLHSFASLKLSSK